MAYSCFAFLSEKYFFSNDLHATKAIVVYPRQNKATWPQHECDQTCKPRTPKALICCEVLKGVGLLFFQKKESTTVENKFQYVNFSESELWRASFVDAGLTVADLEQTDCCKTDFSNAILNAPKWTGVLLHNIRRCNTPENHAYFETENQLIRWNS